MKGLIYGGLSTLLVAISTSGIVSPASAEPITSGEMRVSAPLMMAGETSMSFNFTAPFIASSGVLGSSHFIRVAVIGMSLENLAIAVPSQMERYDKIQVVDQTGREIPAKIAATKDRVTVAFDQPVAPGSYLQVLFTGVEMRQGGGDTLFYGVTAERVGIKGAIPVGTARVHIPSRS